MTLSGVSGFCTFKNRPVIPPEDVADTLEKKIELEAGQFGGKRENENEIAEINENSGSIRHGPGE